MELFVKVMNAVNDIIWHPVMCVFLMCAAVWFTVRLRGIQVRRFKDMVKCLTEKGDNKKDTGLSAFQAFATTVGGRVGTGKYCWNCNSHIYGRPRSTVLDVDNSNPWRFHRYCGMYSWSGI